jgi:hypothetical protein
VALAVDSTAPAAVSSPPTLVPATIAPPVVKANPADAEAVLAAMHYDEMMGKGLNQQKQAALAYTRQMLTKMNLSGTSPQDMEAFEHKALDAAWAGLTPEEIHADAVQIYSEVFTTDELHAMADFYRSPAGQSMMAKQPQVQQKIMAVIRPKMMLVMPKIQQMMHDFVTQQQANVKKAPVGPAAPATGASSILVPPAPSKS